jgi:hypothetical protein
MQRWRAVLCATLLSVGSALVASPAVASTPVLSWWAPVRIDHQPPFSGNLLTGVSCVGASFCVAVDVVGNVITSTNPTGGAAAWTVTNVDGGRNIRAVSCPATNFCVAVDLSGNAITSTNPTGGKGAWTVANVHNPIGMNAISCPSTTLCVATDEGFNVVTSTNPTGGAVAWSSATIDSGRFNFLDAVSCPSASLCVAADQGGNVITSTNPTGGAAAWTRANVDGFNSVNGVSCPATNLCVAVDSSGNVLTSTNPTGGAAAWTIANVDGTKNIFGISCPMSLFCVADDNSGNVITSTNPTGGAGAWTVAKVDGNAFLGGVSCSSSTLCVVGDTIGNVVTSSNPTGGAAAWTVTNVDGANSLDGISCPTSVLCVAVDTTGHAVTSTNPTGGSAAWSVALVDTTTAYPTGVACPSTSLCVAVDSLGNVVTSTNPTGGAAAWTTVHVDSATYPWLSAVSCPTTALCVAVDQIGNVVTSTNPTGGAGAWSVAQAGPTAFMTLLSVSCATTTFCVAGNSSGDIVTSTNPAGGTAAWSAATHVDSAPNGFVNSLSCPTTNLCVGGDGNGDVLTSTNPTGGAGAWTVTHVSPIPGFDQMHVSCASATLCVAVDANGNAYTSTTPAGGAAAWTPTHIDEAIVVAVSCTASGLCVAVDNAGNAMVGRTGTVTTLSSSANPSLVGANVTFTATVSPTPDGGTVAFTDNSVTLTGCQAVAVNTTTGQAACTTNYGALGDHSIAATFSGSANFGVSASAVLTQHVTAPTSPRAVLPAMSNGAYGGYTTAATIQNIGVTAATVRMQYFDQNGSPVGAGDLVSSLPVNASWTVRQDNGNSFPSTGGDAAQAGSAIVSSSQPLAVFVNEFAPGNSSDATSYTAINVASGTGTTIFAPAIANNAYGGYTTGIGLLSLATTSTNITVTYRDSSGAVIKTQNLPGVAAGAYQALYSGDTTLGLPNGFAGTATITSSAGNLAAVINETGPGKQFSSYDAVPAGSTTLYAPAALRNAYGGYNTGMGIQNTTGSAGTVTITYYDANGTPTVKSFPIVANGYVGVYQGTDIPSPGAYTAKITSTVAIAAIVNEVAPSSNPAVQQSTAYNTFASGSSSLHLPLVESAGPDGWSTGEGIMNTGTAATTVTVTYYDAATGVQVGTPDTLSLQPNAFWGLYQPAGGLPSGLRASATITTSAGGQVAVICNESNASTFMSYIGQ